MLFMLLVITEVLWWAGIVQTLRYRGKVKESSVLNGADAEITKLYEERKNNWMIIMWGSLALQFLVIFF